MRVRRWTLCLLTALALLLGTAGLAQAANQIVVVKSEYTKQDYKKTAAGDFDAYWAAFEKIMARIGYENKYDVITDADVEDGRLSVDTWKLAILPVNRAMTKKEADQIIKYVKAGGALFANYNVGLKFENSNDSLNFLIADAIGVDRAPEFSSGVNPNYAVIRAEDPYHPFFAGIPQSVPFLKHYTVLGMPREGVKVVARYYTDGGVPSTVERKSGAIYQIGRVVYNGGNIWDPDKSLDTPELNTLIKNVIAELLSDKTPIALAPPRKLEDGWHYKGRYAVRAIIEQQKVTDVVGGTLVNGVPTYYANWPSLDQDSFKNSTLMVAPRYVSGKFEGGAEIWTNVYTYRPQLAEGQLSGGSPVAVPTIMTAWAKANTKELLLTAALRPDGGFEPIGDLKMVGSSDPLGLVSFNVLNNTNWASNIKMHVKDFKGWNGVVGLGVTQGGWPGLSGAAWTPWTDNAYLYLREDTLKLGKTSRLEAGFTYNQRRLDAWGNTSNPPAGAGPNVANWNPQTQVAGTDLKLKTPYGNMVAQYATSYMDWPTSQGDFFGPALHYPDGKAALIGVERVPVGAMRVSAEVRTMNDTFRNFAWMGMQDHDFPFLAKYTAAAWADDPTNKRAFYDSIKYFDTQAKADEAINSWIKYLGNRAFKSQVNGELVRGVMGVNADYEAITRMEDGSKVFEGGKVELSGKKSIGIFTPKFTIERKKGQEWRWAYYDEKLYTQVSTAGGAVDTAKSYYKNDYHVRDYDVDTNVRTLALDYELSPKITGTIKGTATSLSEFRNGLTDFDPAKPARLVVLIPSRDVQEESTNVHADVKVALSPKTTVTTGVDFYHADTLTSTEDATLGPGHSTSLLAKVDHTFSEKMWGNAAAKVYYREGDSQAKNSAYVDLTRQLTKDINGKMAYLADGVNQQSILYGQLGYSLPIGSTTGIYLKWRRTSPYATGGYTDNAYVSLTHIVGNAQLTASYGKLPFDTTYTDYGNPWDWMSGGSARSYDTAQIDFKITF